MPSQFFLQNTKITKIMRKKWEFLLKAWKIQWIINRKFSLSIWLILNFRFISWVIQEEKVFTEIFFCDITCSCNCGHRYMEIPFLIVIFSVMNDDRSTINLFTQLCEPLPMSTLCCPHSLLTNCVNASVNGLIVNLTTLNMLIFSKEYWKIERK